jgi:PAS domain S-box-containing protein
MPKKEPSTAAAENRYVAELRAKDRLLHSIHKIGSLLTRPISLDKILTTIVKETSQAFGFTRVAIFLADKERKLLECKYLIGFSAEASERALHLPYHLEKHDCIETKVAGHGKTIYVKDYRTDPRVTDVDLKVSRIMNRVSTLAVPLKTKKDIIGLIEADKNDVKLKLTRKDIDAFTTFANQAGIVIENARLQEQNQKKIRQLLTLQEISGKMSSIFNLGELLRTISASALKIAGGSSSLLFLVEDNGERLNLASRNGVENLSTGEPGLMRGEGIAGWVAKHSAPLLASNARQDPRYRKIVKGMESELAVPLISEKRVLGVLSVGSTHQAAFSEDDSKLLMIFAGHAASLIRNARLYGQVITERNLRENILESSPSGVIAVNLKKEVTSINRVTEKIFNLKRADVLGRQASQVFDEDILNIMDLALEGNNVIDSREIRKAGKDGASLILGVSSSLLESHQGDLIGVLLNLRDLTEAKRTEELIARMDKLSSLGQLSAGIAHEIRNPLSSINFNVQLLAKRLPLDDAARAIVNDTLEGIDRIKNLVKGMIDFSRPSTPDLKTGSVARVFENSMALVDSQLRKSKVVIRLELDEDLPRIVFDEHQIQQVFVNLAMNGVEAMPGGGSIKISGTVEKDGHTGTDRLEIRFADTGPGIGPENLPRVFDPFFTTKPEGTGLGLSIVHKILEQHRASIQVFSEKGEGTTFVLSFPIPSGGRQCC